MWRACSRSLSLYAVRLRLLPHNVAANAHLLGRKKGGRRGARRRLAMFLESVSGERLFPQWRLALATSFAGRPRLQRHSRA